MPERWDWKSKDFIKENDGWRWGAAERGDKKEPEDQEKGWAETS